MNAVNPRLTTEVPLPQFTEEVRQGRQITWYRSPLPPGAAKRLHVRSDWLGARQALGHLGIMLATGALAIWSANHWAWWATGLLIFLHGMVASFMVNAVHELLHGTVFATKRWNGFFCAVFSFLGWINPEMFQASHVRHHRYTLHPPDDLEVVLPGRLVLADFFRCAVFNYRWLWESAKIHTRIARGIFCGEWELTLYPENEPERRRPAVRWSRALWLGHGIVALIGVVTGQWILPVVISLAPFIGNGLFWLCNNTQHIGLTDEVADFRLCCRTFTLNPAVRFLYWQMNYHIEHHMFAAVPCYRLTELHRLIRDDLPPTPHGLVAVWREIGAIMVKQQADPGYQHLPALPVAGATRDTAGARA